MRHIKQRGIILINKNDHLFSGLLKDSLHQVRKAHIWVWQMGFHPIPLLVIFDNEEEVSF